MPWCGVGGADLAGYTERLMAALPREYRLQPQTVAELSHLAEGLVPATLQFLTCQGCCFPLLQVHGQRAICPGVAEVTSLPASCVVCSTHTCA